MLTLKEHTFAPETAAKFVARCEASGSHGETSGGRGPGERASQRVANARRPFPAASIVAGGTETELEDRRSLGAFSPPVQAPPAPIGPGTPSRDGVPRAGARLATFGPFSGPAPGRARRASATALGFGAHTSGSGGRTARAAATIDSDTTASPWQVASVLPN